MLIPIFMLIPIHIEISTYVSICMYMYKHSHISWPCMKIQ